MILVQCYTLFSDWSSA